MSELISGKKALIAIANGEEVQFCDDMGVWNNAGIHTYAIGLFLNDCYKFRLKPHTIYMNDIEVPAPFEPKKGEMYFYLSDEYDGGYSDHKHDASTIEIAAWRTEEEIKQVVTALRSVFGKK